MGRELQSEVAQLRVQGDDAHRQNNLTYEQNVSKVTEVEMATQYAQSEMKRLRSDHDQAIANLAENMNKWNDTIRDLSKDFHDFQKVMNVNHQRIQSSVWEVQAKASGQNQPPTEPLAGARMDSSGDAARSPQAWQGVPQGGMQAQSPAGGVQPRRTAPAQAQIGMVPPTYTPAGSPGPTPYQMVR